MEIIDYADFARVELRSGTIIKVEHFIRAKNPSYKIWADFGEELGVRKTSAQITAHYHENDLVGRQIIGCMNLGQKNIAGFISEFLLLGFSDPENKICIATVERPVPNGKKLH